MIYAGFWRRFVAVVLDFFILCIPMMALYFAVPYVGSVVLALFYYPVFESSPMQATPGKYWMGLRVLNQNGQTLSFPRAVARHLLKYVSACLLAVGYLIQLFTEKRQALHDLVVSSVVVKSEGIESPDWIQTWLRHMRFILRVEEGVEAPAKSTTASQVNEQNATVSQSTAGSAETATQSIEKLYDLYKSGALTEEEFQGKKSELLSQI